MPRGRRSRASSVFAIFVSSCASTRRWRVMCGWQVPEPLHLLEKAALSLEVTRTYANGAYSTKTVLASRAVDVVLTYQDMKRCYAIYRAFLREDDRAGFSKSKGVSYLSELLEKDDLAPSRQARARSLSITSQSTTGPTLAVPGTSELQVRLDVATLCLVNDCMGSTAPFATLTLKGASVDVTSHPDQSMAIAASVTLDVAFYNIMSSCFEPIMEPWTLKVTATETEGRAASALKVESLSRVEFNLSEMHLRGAVQTVEGWLQDTKTWGADPDAVNDKFWPYRLRNESGVPIFFWLGSTHGSATCRWSSTPSRSGSKESRTSSRTCLSTSRECTCFLSGTSGQLPRSTTTLAARSSLFRAPSSCTTRPPTLSRRLSATKKAMASTSGWRSSRETCTGVCRSNSLSPSTCRCGRQGASTSCAPRSPCRHPLSLASRSSCGVALLTTRPRGPRPFISGCAWMPSALSAGNPYTLTTKH
ncbi:hypothetical protein T484DRAFT_3047618 [Baffinella frigidus]|nr:hypothetical protein T484DRAFT_3047618 [Cryptophyta sp. CCMP2293]